MSKSFENIINVQPKRIVSLDEITQQEMLGKGQFGVVYRILYQGQTYAMKQIVKQTLIRHGKINSAVLELKIMYQLDHENIMKLITHFEDENNVYLILEYIDGSNLYDILKRDTRLQETYAIHYYRQIVSTLIYLHSRPTPILHRDIKPENILITKNNAIKLADFGSANSLAKDELRFTFEGTYLFMAPEIYLNKGYTQCVDIWSLGVLLFEILAGHSPFLNKEEENSLMTHEKQTVIRENVLNVRIRFPDTFPPLARDLVRKILRLEPQDRLRLEEVLKHPWLQNAEVLEQLPIVTKNPLENLVSQQISKFSESRKNNNNHLIRISELKKSINETQIQIMKGELEKQQLSEKLKELQEVNDDQTQSPNLVSPEKIVKIEEKYNRLKKEINQLQKEIIQNEMFINKNEMQQSKLNHYKSKIEKQKEIIEKLERELIQLDQKKKLEQINQDRELQEFTKLNNNRNIEQSTSNNSQYTSLLRETIERFKEFMNFYRNIKQEPETDYESQEDQQWKKEYYAIKKSLQEEFKQEQNLLMKLENENQQLKIKLGQIEAQEQQVQKAEQIVTNLKYGCDLKQNRIDELKKIQQDLENKIDCLNRFIEYNKSSQ
ncbi:unnamed protein product [Paramecium octaurelia]|uniref:Protein kinase domain-containing protein n=1 Tax=Paramecium octaurelia TaxID=43137 RepID=A0A8S1WJR0_PAROT|nr:unnamed protein product [Paramecium octaurelia]